MFSGLFTNIFDDNYFNYENITKDKFQLKFPQNVENSLNFNKNNDKHVIYIAKKLAGYNKLIDIKSFYEFLIFFNSVLKLKNIDQINYLSITGEIFNSLINLKENKISPQYKQILLQNICKLSNIKANESEVNNKTLKNTEKNDSFKKDLDKEDQHENNNILKDNSIKLINNNYNIHQNNIIMINNPIVSYGNQKNKQFLGRKYLKYYQKKDKVILKTKEINILNDEINLKVEKKEENNDNNDNNEICILINDYFKEKEKQEEKFIEESSEKKLQEKNVVKKKIKLKLKNKNIKHFSEGQEKKVVMDLFKNKSSVNFFIFEDKYKNLISNVDRPKRRKRVHLPSLKQEYKIYLEKAKIFQNELIEFNNTIYDSELNKLLGNNKHIFMRNHFPSMYEGENFYKYYYQINKNRENFLKENIVQNISQPNPENRMNDKYEMKLIWKQNEKEINDKEIEELLFKVEMKFPIEEFKWTQEVVLELLMKENYNPESLLKVLNNETFKQEIEEREAELVEIEEIPSNKKLSLRRTYQRNNPGFYFNK